jgi:hypothetical protein
MQEDYEMVQPAKKTEKEQAPVENEKKRFIVRKISKPRTNNRARNYLDGGGIMLSYNTLNDLGFPIKKDGSEYIKVTLIDKNELKIVKLDL